MMAYKGGQHEGIKDCCLMKALNIAEWSVARQEESVYMHMIWALFSDKQRTYGFI